MLRTQRTPRAGRHTVRRSRRTTSLVAGIAVLASAASVLLAVSTSEAATPQAAIPETVAGAAALPTSWATVVNSASGKCLDARSAATANGTAVQQYSCNNSTAQHWSFTATSGGFLRINNRNDANQVADVSDVSTADNAAVHLWTYGGGANQQWQAVDEGGGAYHFVNRNSGKCLDVPSASTADSVQLVQYTCNGSGAQSFRLTAQP